ATTATAEQRISIESAQSGGTLPVVVGNSINVTANGSNAWTLRLQHKNTAGTFVHRARALGTLTQVDNIKTQFVSASDNSDTTIRIEQVVTQPQPGDTFVVQGTVRYVNGDVFAGTVKAFDKDLRHEQELGTATTDVAGAYKITYGASAFGTAELRTADLVVRALKADGSILAESPIVFNAGSVEIIDLIIGALAPTALSE